jgi:DNA invertase Pin-like site-specific DNA recombinase
MCVCVGSGDRVIGYARVSTEEQGVSGAGLEAQRAGIESECARRGWRLARIVEDVLSAKR